MFEKLIQRFRRPPVPQEKEIRLTADEFARYMERAIADERRAIAIALVRAHDKYADRAVANDNPRAARTLLAKAQAVRYCLHAIGESGLALSLGEALPTVSPKFLPDEDGNLVQVLD